MEILGARNLVIFDGSVPEALRGTKFFPGEVGSGIVSQVYTIKNTSPETLQLGTSPVVLTGSPQITVSEQPLVTSLGSNSSTTFSLSFNRSVFGLHVGTVNVLSNASGSPFTFQVEGRAYNAGPPATFTFGGATPIPDNDPAGVTIPIHVAGLSGQICTLQVKANGTDCSVAESTGIQHTWIGDLTMEVTSPAGKTIKLFDRPGVPATTFGNSGDNLCQTVFDDTAAKPLETALSGEAPFTGAYLPEHPLYELAGDNSNGIWNVRIADHGAGDLGTVRSLALIFRTETSPADAKDWQLYY